MPTGTLNVSKSTTYLQYDSNGNYSEEGDVYLITFIGPTTSDAGYCFGSSSISNLRVVSSNGYSNTPYVVFSVVGSFSNKSSISGTIKWTPRTPHTAVTENWTLNISNSNYTQTTYFYDFYGGASGWGRPAGTTSNYLVRRIDSSVMNKSDGYVYVIDSWDYNGTEYTANRYTAIPNPNGDINFYPKSYHHDTVSLYVDDYPTVGTNTKISTQNRCVSGTGLTKFTIPSNPSQTYYVFNRFSNYNNTVQYTAGQQLEASTGYTVYARWTGYSFNIAYNINTTGTTPSSIATTQVTYPNTFTLPSLIKPNYTFTGWSYGGKTYAPGTQFPIEDYPATNNATLTFTSVFVPLSYRVTFKDADGTVETTTAYTNFGTAVNIPTAPNRPAFDFKWWSLEGSTTQALSKDATTYSPLSVTENQQTIVFIRRYSYTRTLKGTATPDVTYKTVSGDYPNAVDLPTESNHDQNMELSGYRIKGWSTTKQTPNKATNPTAQYTTQYTPNLSDTFTTLYIARIPATLNSITLGSRLLVRVGVPTEVSRNTTPPSVTIDPPDWLGTLEWYSPDDSEATFFSIVSSGDLSATVTGKNSTSMVGSKTLKAKARKETWNQSSAYVTSSDMLIDVSTYLQIDFYTRDDSGSLIPFTKSGHSGNSWFVDDSYGNLVWKNTDGTTEGAYPGNPTRNNHAFICWVDGDGKLVDETHPPDHNTVCTATWMRRYEATDRDVLILQQFNRDGNALMLELDSGVITSVNENFSTTLSVTPTPTMPSENTFIIDTGCSESIPFKVIRKHPIDYNDDTDDSRKWSNGKWITELRALVDRWQSETDGVKVLYIPNGLRMTTVLDETVCYGRNYDLLGYCLSSNDNIGILYDNDSKVLVGYNAIISSYTDTYSAGTNNVIEVNLTVSIGGMKSQYQDWANSLLLRDN